jgi:hypothetical protein
MFLKNKILGIICQVVFVLCLNLSCGAQVIENRINFYMEYAKGSFFGSDMIKINSFNYPSLFNNMNTLDNKSLKLLIKGNKYLSFGIQTFIMHASKWEYTERPDYQYSNVTFLSFSPIIQVHSRFTKTGFLNRFRIFTEIAPTLGLSKLKLGKPLFEIQKSASTISSPMDSSDKFFGMGAKVGMEYSINNFSGVFLNYTLQYNRVKSILFNDNHFTNSLIGFGIMIKLSKIKRFYY